jgi:predicted SAM-dependent methyltransferase
MNLNATSINSIFNKYYLWNWKGILEFEFRSALGRTFLNKKPVRTEVNILHLGCATNYIDGWVNADFFYYRKFLFWKEQPKVDWLLDIRYPLNCPDDYWQGVFTEHTLEHVHPDDLLKLLKELHRTMKSGAWIRIIVPGLDEALKAYEEPNSEEGKWMRNELGLSTRAEMIRYLTQNWGHLGVWDAELMCKMLGMAGFSECQKSEFGKSNDMNLVKDLEARKVGSLYVEARKA